MQIPAITNVQNNKQTFGVKPYYLNSTVKEIFAKKLSPEEIDKVVQLFTDTDLKTQNLTNFNFGIRRGNRLFSKAYAQKLSYNVGNSVECTQRLFESTFKFLKRACANAVKLNEKVDKQLAVNKALEKI